MTFNQLENLICSPRLLGLDLGLHFVFIRGLQPPEWIRTVPIAIEELCRLRCVVQHVLSRQSLSLTDVSDLIVL